MVCLLGLPWINKICLTTDPKRPIGLEIKDDGLVVVVVIVGLRGRISRG